MQQNDLARDGETQSGTACRWILVGRPRDIGSKEALEDPLLNSRRNSLTRIDDRDLVVLIPMRHADLDNPSWPRMLDRVVEARLTGGHAHILLADVAA